MSDPVSKLGQGRQRGQGRVRSRPRPRPRPDAMSQRQRPKILASKPRWPRGLNIPGWEYARAAADVAGRHTVAGR